MPYKEFGAEVLLAADVNDYLMRQVVARVPDVPARDAIPGPGLGQRCFVESTGTEYVFDGTTWAAGLWTPYTPVLVGTTTSPNLGSTGIAEGRYQIAGGALRAWGRFEWAGSGVTAGSGNYRIMPPLDPATWLWPNGALGQGPIVGLWATRASSGPGNNSRGGHIQLAGNGGMLIFGDSTQMGQGTAANLTLGTAGSAIQFMFDYPVA